MRKIASFARRFFNGRLWPQLLPLPTRNGLPTEAISWFRSLSGPSISGAVFHLERPLSKPATINGLPSRKCWFITGLLRLLTTYHGFCRLEPDAHPDRAFCHILLRLVSHRSLPSQKSATACSASGWSLSRFILSFISFSACPWSRPLFLSVLSLILGFLMMFLVNYSIGIRFG